MERGRRFCVTTATGRARILCHAFQGLAGYKLTVFRRTKSIWKRPLWRWPRELRREDEFDCGGARAVVQGLYHAA
jgi:hypothetical protein